MLVGSSRAGHTFTKEVTEAILSFNKVTFYLYANYPPIKPSRLVVLQKPVILALSNQT